MIPVTISADVQHLVLGIVAARGLSIGPSTSALRELCDTAARRIVDSGMAGGEARREQVRQMLRAGGFKPAGRNKPAQEYLFKTASESGQLPAILNAVDLLNIISLQSGLPISLLAHDRLLPLVNVRYGKRGERFVFNRAGQDLDVEGLLCVCRYEEETSIPLGTPIKDSMAGKIESQDRDVVAFLYAPGSVVNGEELADWCARLGRGFVDHCGAASHEWATMKSA